MSGDARVGRARPAHLWAGVLGGGVLVAIGILDGLVVADAWRAVLAARDAVAGRGLGAGWYGGSGSVLADGRWPWMDTVISAILGSIVLAAAIYGLIRATGCAAGLRRLRATRRHS